MFILFHLVMLPFRGGRGLFRATRGKRITLWAGAPRKVVIPLCILAGCLWGLHVLVSHHGLSQAQQDRNIEQARGAVSPQESAWLRCSLDPPPGQICQTDGTSVPYPAGPNDAAPQVLPQP